MLFSQLSSSHSIDMVEPTAVVAWQRVTWLNHINKTWKREDPSLPYMEDGGIFSLPGFIDVI